MKIKQMIAEIDRMYPDPKVQRSVVGRAEMSRDRVYTAGYSEALFNVMIFLNKVNNEDNK